MIIIVSLYMIMERKYTEIIINQWDNYSSEKVFSGYDAYTITQINYSIFLNALKYYLSRKMISISSDCDD